MDLNAGIKISVLGVQGVEKLINKSKTLNGIIDKINAAPITLNVRKDDSIAAAIKQLNDFSREVVNGEKHLANNEAALQQQSGALRQYAANLKTGSVERKNALQAQVKAEQKLTFAQYDQIEAQSKMLMLGKQQNNESFKGIRGLIDYGASVKNNTKSLDLYAQQLREAISFVEIGSREYRELALAINSVNKQLEAGQKLAKAPVATTQYGKPIGPQRKGAKPGAGRSALETAGQFGLGTGFPLLFGGGAGQVIGGGLGTALAGAFGLAGQAAMGLQIGLSAIIGKAEELITRFKDVGNAINSLSMDALASSFITVTEETRTLVRQLVEAGNAQAAVSVAANEVYNQTRLTPDSVSDITNNLNVLSNAWDEVVATVAGLVSLVAKDLLIGLSIVLKTVSLIAKGMNVLIQKAQELGNTKFFKTVLGLVPGIGGPLVAYATALEEVQKNTKGISEEEEKALALAKQKVDQVQTEVIRGKELYDLEKTRTKGKTAAEKLTNAEIEKAVDLKKLEFETQDKILAIRTEHAGVEDSVLQKLIDGEKALAKIKQLRINDAFAIEQQNIALAAQRELDKQAKEDLKIKIEQHKIAQGAIQAQTTLLEGQIQIFNLQAQAAQSVFAVTQARNKSELSALKLEESRLQRRLEKLQRIDGFYNKQRNIINKIAQNRKKQAELEFKVTQQSIKQMVAKAELERQAVRFQVQKINLQIELLRLQAEEIEDTQKKLESLARINQQAKISAEIAKQMTISADKSLASAKEIAKFQKLSAQHLLDGKLESIEAERVDARRAVHAAAIARDAKAAAKATSSGSGSSDSFLGQVTTQKMSTSGPIDPDVYNKVIEQAPFFGYKHPADLINALDKAQADKNAMIARNERIAQKGASSIGAAQMGSVSTRAGSAATKAGLAMVGEKGPEYIVPEKKAGAFATNYLMGARGAGAIPRYAEGGYTGSINIQTGPVMQQDNQTYLTIGQFEEGMRELTESLARGGRSYGSRQFQGIS